MISVDQIRPIKDRVLIRPDPVKTKIGSIHVPEMVNKDNPNYFTMTGEVIACGPGGLEAPMPVSVGDRVVFSRYAGKQLVAMAPHPLMGERKALFLMLRQDEILGLADTEYIQPGYQGPKFSAVKKLSGDAA